MKSGIRFFGLVSICLWLLCWSGCAFVSIPLMRETEPFEEKTLTGSGKNKILLVDLSGVITDQDKRSVIGFGKEVSDVARIKVPVLLLQAR